MRNRIKNLCKEQGLTLIDLAEKMGIARENLTRAISEKGNPTLETIQKIAKALKVELWELFTDSMPLDLTSEVHGVIYVQGKPNLINSMKDLEDLICIAKSGKS